MDYREELIRNLMMIIQEANYPEDKLGFVRNRILLELDKFDICAKCTDLCIIDTESEKYIKLYLAMSKMSGKSERTIAAYDYLLNRYRLEIDKPVLKMNALEIQIWLAKVQQSASMRTCENYRSYLSSFYAWLFKENILTVNPMSKIEPVKYEDKVKQAFTEVDLDKLRSACSNEKERAIFELLVTSGARVSELCAMNKTDIDFAAKSVVIRKGKGGKQRFVYFSDVCREHLQTYLEKCIDDGPWLFSNKRHGRMNVRSVERMLFLLGQKAHVENVHPHRCRRTFATDMCRKGMDLSTLQTLMGHSNTNTTQGYVSLSQDHIHNQYNRYT